jgi:hypothetical protein
MPSNFKAQTVKEKLLEKVDDSMLMLVQNMLNDVKLQLRKKELEMQADKVEPRPEIDMMFDFARALGRGPKLDQRSLRLLMDAEKIGEGVALSGHEYLLDPRNLSNEARHMQRVQLEMAQSLFGAAYGRRRR